METIFAPNYGFFHETDGVIKYSTRQTFTNQAKFYAATADIIYQPIERAPEYDQPDFPAWKVSLEHTISGGLFIDAPFDSYFDLDLILHDGRFLGVDDSNVATSRTERVNCVFTIADDLDIVYPTNAGDPPVINAINSLSGHFDIVYNISANAHSDSNPASRTFFGKFLTNGTYNGYATATITPTRTSTGTYQISDFIIFSKFPNQDRYYAYYKPASGLTNPSGSYRVY